MRLFHVILIIFNHLTVKFTTAKNKSLNKNALNLIFNLFKSIDQNIEVYVWKNIS